MNIILNTRLFPLMVADILVDQDVRLKKTEARYKLFTNFLNLNHNSSFAFFKNVDIHIGFY